jgi:hypothetical protein
MFSNFNSPALAIPNLATSTNLQYATAAQQPVKDPTHPEEVPLKFTLTSSPGISTKLLLISIKHHFCG